MLVVPGKLQISMIDNIPQLEPKERSAAPETRPRTLERSNTRTLERSKTARPDPYAPPAPARNRDASFEPHEPVASSFVPVPPATD